MNESMIKYLLQHYWRMFLALFHGSYGKMMRGMK